MIQRTVSHLIEILWLFTALVVIGYPLVRGEIRAGLSRVNRSDSPNAFWTAYLLSTALFLGISAAGFWLLRMQGLL